MNVAHLNLVGVARTGMRFPIVGLNVPSHLRPSRGIELPLELVLLTAKAQHAAHEVIQDARPWLVFAGTDDQASKWAETNHMAPERWRRVRTESDISGITLGDWQFTAIGTWQRDRKVREAALSLAKRWRD